MEEAIRIVLEDLFDLQPLMLNRSMGIAQNENFSPVQLYVLFTLLYVLFTLQCRGEMTLADCCRQTLISKQQLSKLIDGLVTRGIVARKPNPSNRRSILISISSQGSVILQEYKEKQIRHLTPYFAQLSEDELATLHRSFQDITQIMRKLHYKENTNHA